MANEASGPRSNRTISADSESRRARAAADAPPATPPTMTSFMGKALQGRLGMAWPGGPAWRRGGPPRDPARLTYVIRVAGRTFYFAAPTFNWGGSLASGERTNGSSPVTDQNSRAGPRG